MQTELLRQNGFSLPTTDVPYGDARCFFRTAHTCLLCIQKFFIGFVNPKNILNWSEYGYSSLFLNHRSFGFQDRNIHSETNRKDQCCKFGKRPFANFVILQTRDCGDEPLSSYKICA